MLHLFCATAIIYPVASSTQFRDNTIDVTRLEVTR